MKLIFCMQISMKARMILMGMVKHFQSSQNSKLAMSLQCLIKEVRDEVHFLHADQHHSFYKLMLSFLMEVVRLAQSTQNVKLVIFFQYIKKKCCNCFCVLF